LLFFSRFPFPSAPQQIFDRFGYTSLTPAAAEVSQEPQSNSKQNRSSLIPAPTAEIPEKIFSLNFFLRLHISMYSIIKSVVDKNIYKKYVIWFLTVLKFKGEKMMTII